MIQALYLVGTGLILTAEPTFCHLPRNAPGEISPRLACDLAGSQVTCFLGEANRDALPLTTVRFCQLFRWNQNETHL
jgi:hypothetical protein